MTEEEKKKKEKKDWSGRILVVGFGESSVRFSKLQKDGKNGELPDTTVCETPCTALP